MTEKEKMMAGMIYDANYDKELIEDRIKAKDMCHKYNQLLPSDEDKKREVMKDILGKTKENFTITAPFWCDYGYNIEIGENFYKYYQEGEYPDSLPPFIEGKYVECDQWGNTDYYQDNG